MSQGAAAVSTQMLRLVQFQQQHLWLSDKTTMAFSGLPSNIRVTVSRWNTPLDAMWNP
jgi:hypothetical protein